MSARNILTPGTVTHHGIKFPGLLSETQLEKVREFSVDTGDWIVVGYPKSGTTWLSVVMGLIKHNGVVAIDEPAAIFKNISYIDGTVENSSETPKIYKSHLPIRLVPEKWLKCKIVVPLRNPKDVAVSFYHFYRSHSTLGLRDEDWNQFYQKYITGDVIYGECIPWIRDWYQQQKENINVFFINYSYMKRKPAETIRNVARFLGRDLSDDVVEKIAEMSRFESMRENQAINPEANPIIKDNINNDISRFMRKGIEGDWKNYLTVAQAESYDQVFREKMGELRELDYLLD